MIHKNSIIKKIFIIGITGFIIGNISSIAIDIDNNLVEKINNNLTGTTWYVGGDGAGNYTYIQYAIDNASSGDTVFVYDDSSPYYENINVNKSINLIGENRETTIIDSCGNKIVVNISVNFVNFSGFTLTNNASDWVGYYGILLRSDNNHIFNNTINLGDGIGINLNTSYNIISSNIISNNFVGINLHFCGNNTISDNIISKNNWGLDLVRSTNNIFSGNTINSNIWRGITLHHWSHKNIFTRNIIKSNTGSGITIFYSNQNIISNNNFENNEKSIGLIDSSFNKIKNNNIIGNKLDPYFHDSIGNQWRSNYWGENKKLPKLIFGSFVLIHPPAHGPGFSLEIPWINFDFFPAKKPYDIGI
jgi:parallel beta-helix repeat protein